MKVWQASVLWFLPGGRRIVRDLMRTEQLEVRLQAVTGPHHYPTVLEEVNRLAERPWDPHASSEKTGRERALQIAFDFVIFGSAEVFLRLAPRVQPHRLARMLTVSRRRWRDSPLGEE